MNVVVLAGGISTERDVSLVSGKMIYNALKTNGHNAILLDVYLGTNETDVDNIFTLEKDWVSEINPVQDENPDIEKIKALRPDGDKQFFGPNVITICQYLLTPPGHQHRHPAHCPSTALTHLLSPLSSPSWGAVMLHF